ncbi:hypothetical protein BYT27DRAFT_6701839 [Phlegmacium glaucopus]|nr:hypothetical protein BYT27DRAFT_6701839 [Phlegmacium glaucopus]
MCQAHGVPLPYQCICISLLVDLNSSTSPDPTQYFFYNARTVWVAFPIWLILTYMDFWNRSRATQGWALLLTRGLTEAFAGHV